MARQVGSLRRRTSAVSHSRTNARARLIEAALWLVAIGVALTLLIPAAYQLHAANQDEVAEGQQTRAKEQELRKAEQELEWLVNDPLTDQRISDTQGVRQRKQNATGAPTPTE